MIILQDLIHLKSRQRSHWIDITDDVQKVVSKSTIKEGICTVVCLHTTASITVNENADPDVEKDFFKMLEQLIPINASFRHAEGNSDSHIKASLTGLSAQLPVNGARLVLGTWQSVYFCEFDGPRSRKVSVTVMGQ
jgi:secondary thiamine-phosphate synthase enzyme